MDNVKLSGAWTHGIELNGAENLTVTNSVLMAATADGEPGPFIKSARNVRFLNNAFLRGWRFPSFSYGCGLTGNVVIRNNIFYHAGTGQPHVQLEDTECTDPPADWPPTLDVNYNAYVGSGNFDSQSFWIDRRDPVHAVNYYADGVPGFPEWQNEMGFDANSIVLDNIDFREASSQVWPSGRLWGETAPFWGAPVRCSIDNNSFDTSQSWIGGLAVGDKIEFDWDGIPRVITSFALGSGSAMDGCEWEVTFAPALNAPAPVGSWFLVYSDDCSSVSGKSFSLDPDAAVIDRGDPNPSNCGHSIIGTRCDIGPSEYDATGGPDRGPCDSVIQFNSDKVTVQWNPTIGALGHHVYRDLLAELIDENGDGLPDAGCGWCMTAQDSDPSDTEFADQEEPPSGSGYFYLTSCYDDEGEWGLGSTSSGLQRNVLDACP